MNHTTFWTLIDQPEQLLSRLVALPPAEIASFQEHLDACRAGVDTWAHWHAADVIHGRALDDDEFYSFQSWIIGLGEARFSRVRGDPDALADLDPVRAVASGLVDELQWDELGGLAWDAYQQVTGLNLSYLLDSRGHSPPEGPDPAEQWDFSSPVETARRIPRLGELFGAGCGEVA